MSQRLKSQHGFSILISLAAIAIVSIIAYAVSFFIESSNKTAGKLTRNASCEMVVKAAQELINSSDNGATISSFGPTTLAATSFPQSLDTTPDSYDRFYLNRSIPFFLSEKDFLRLPNTTASYLVPEEWFFSNYLNYKNSANRLLAFAANKAACCKDLECYQEFLGPNTTPQDLYTGEIDNIKILLALNVVDKNSDSHCAGNLFNSSKILDPKTARINYKFRAILNENTNIQKACEASGVVSYPSDKSPPLALLQVDVGNLCASHTNATLTSNTDIRIQVKTLTGSVPMTGSDGMPLDSCISSCLELTNERTCANKDNIGIFANFNAPSCVVRCGNTDPGSLFLCRIGEKKWFFDNPDHWEPCNATQVYACNGSKAADVTINHTNPNIKANATTAELLLKNFTKNGEYMIDIRAIDANGNIGPSFCGYSKSCDAATDIPHVTVANVANNPNTPVCSVPVCSWEYGDWSSCPTEPCGTTATQTRSVTCSCGTGNCTGIPDPDTQICDTLPCANGCRWIPQAGLVCLSPTGGSISCGQSGQEHKRYRCFCEEPVGSGHWEDYGWSAFPPCTPEPNRPLENFGTPCTFNCPPPPPCSPPDWRPPSHPTTCCRANQTYHSAHPCYVATPPPPPTCTWNLGDFTCNTSTGIATRTVTCSCAAGGCPSPTPPTEQSCDACSWQTNGWGACTNGTQTQLYACEFPNGTACTTCTGAAPSPAPTQSCGSCTWTSTGWSACTDNRETEQFACRYANGTTCTTCPGSAPSNTRACGTCSWTATGWGTCNSGTQLRLYECRYASGTTCTTCANPNPGETQPCGGPACSWVAQTSTCQNGTDADCPSPRINLGSGSCLEEPPKIPKFATTTYSCRETTNPTQSCNTCTGQAPATTRTNCGITSVLCPGYSVGSCGVGYCCRVGSSPCQVGGCSSGASCLQCESSTTTYTWQSYSSEDVNCASANCSLYLGQPCSPRLDQIMCCASPFRRRILECR